MSDAPPQPASPVLAPDGLADGLVPPVPILSLRVVCLDADPPAAESLGTLLRLFGADVRVCPDAAAALAAADAFRPDVAIVGVAHGSADGCEVAPQVRDRAAGRPVLLVALTAAGDVEAPRRTALYGFNHTFVKPVEPRALVQALIEFQDLKDAAG